MFSDHDYGKSSHSSSFQFQELQLLRSRKFWHWVGFYYTQLFPTQPLRQSHTLVFRCTWCFGEALGVKSWMNAVRLVWNEKTKKNVLCRLRGMLLLPRSHNLHCPTPIMHPVVYLGFFLSLCLVGFFVTLLGCFFYPPKEPVIFIPVTNKT